MFIIFAQALMDDLNSRENWNIQDWMYYAQHTDESAKERLTIVGLIFLIIVIKVSPLRKSVSLEKDYPVVMYILRTFKYLVQACAKGGGRFWQIRRHRRHRRLAALLRAPPDI